MSNMSGNYTEGDGIRKSVKPTAISLLILISLPKIENGSYLFTPSGLSVEG